MDAAALVMTVQGTLGQVLTLSLAVAAEAQLEHLSQAVMVARLYSEQGVVLAVVES